LSDLLPRHQVQQRSQWGCISWDVLPCSRPPRLREVRLARLNTPDGQAIACTFAGDMPTLTVDMGNERNIIVE
jgi:hypothetical protein